MQEFKLKHLLLKLFEITISYHSSGVNTLQCHFMNKNLNRCECVSCFDNILVVNPEERFTHDAAQKKLGSCFWVGFDLFVFYHLYFLSYIEAYIVLLIKVKGLR